VGGQEPREIASGLQQFVALEDMRGKVIVMANLKPRPLAGFNSNGMVVCASNHEHTKVELLVPEGIIGERLYLEGLEDLFPAGEVAIVKKSKVLEKVVEHFATDAEGFVVWKGYRLRTKAGFIKSTIQSGKVS
jgi:tRNA-binding EMAP/Myf-like protein